MTYGIKSLGFITAKHLVPNSSNSFTVLNLEYLTNSKNSNIKLAKQNSYATPTDLAVLAANQALTKANLNASDIDLVIADGVTPDQITPAEAQRIAAALQIQVSAFDQVAGTGAFALICEYLLNIDSSKFPENILWISTNCPTQWIDYSDNNTAKYFSDSASAVIFSKSSKYKIKVAKFKTFYKYEFNFSFPINNHLKFNTEDVFKTLKLCFKELWEEIAPLLQSKSGYYLNLNPLLKFALKEEKVNSNYIEIASFLADSLGSSVPGQLCTFETNFKNNAKIINVMLGPELAGGFVILELHE